MNALILCLITCTLHSTFAMDIVPVGKFDKTAQAILSPMAIKYDANITELDLIIALAKLEKPYLEFLNANFNRVAKISGACPRDG